MSANLLDTHSHPPSAIEPGQALQLSSRDERDTVNPIGGADPSRFDWKEAWHPVYYVDDLDPAQLATFTLLGIPLVIWWDESSQIWQAFEDKCPHRLAPLSEGRVAADGLLECPYHGWAFSGSGECERIPQQVEGRTAEASRRACVRVFPTTVCQGLLFVYPGHPDNASKASVPRIDPLEEEPEDWVCINTFRDLPYDALTLLENVLDPSHLPYTHHQSVGNRANAGPAELEVAESSRQGFHGVWQEGPRLGKLGRQDTIFKAPGLMWHDLVSKQYGRTMTVVYATPIRKGECRLFARFPFKFPSKIPALVMKSTPKWYSHIGQNAILEDDQIFLHHQERLLEESQHRDQFAKAFYLPTKADRFVTELHRWLHRYHAHPFPGESLPPALPKQQLLDRYHSHTVNCASCRTALKNLRRLRLGTAIVAAIAWTLVPLLVLALGQSAVWAIALSSVVTLTVGTAWALLGQLEQRFIHGRTIPPRNLPEKS